MGAQAILKENLDCSEYKQKLINKDGLLELERYTQDLFNSDMRNLKAKIDLLKLKNEVLKSQNDGLENQITSNKRLLASFQREIHKWKKLLKSDAVDELKIIETQRKIEQNNLQIGMLKSKIKENLVTIKSNIQQIELEKEAFENIALTKFNEIKLENWLIHDAIVSLRNTIQKCNYQSTK